MSTDPETVVRAYYAAYEVGDIDTALSFMSDDVIYEDLALEFRSDTKEFLRKTWVRYFEVAANDEHRSTLHRVTVVPSGDYFIEWTERTLQNRDWGILPATGLPWEVRGASAGRVVDGLIVHNRDYYNLATILRQCGIDRVPG